MTMCTKLMLTRFAPSILGRPPLPACSPLLARFKSFSLRQTATRGVFTHRAEINKQIRSVRSAKEHLQTEAKAREFTTSFQDQTDEEDENFNSFPGLRIAKKVALGEARGKNFVFSPLSIQLALSLLANGATGLTKQELLNFLEVKNLNDHNLYIKDLLGSITQTSKHGPVISFISGVWIEQTWCLNPKFKTDAENIYKVKVETVDFQHKASEVINEVNQWAEDATNGLIKSILPQGSLDSMTRLVLANALYFKGRWVDPFDKSLTKNSRFYLLDGKSVEVPFMTSRDRQHITTYEDFKILQLPYVGYMGQDFTMHIILPNKSDGIWPLIEKVGTDPKFGEKYLNNVPPAVKVGKFGLPKFKITHEFEASEILQGLGLKLCMSEKAEFDKIVSYFKPGDQLQVFNIHQKSYIEVNEKGTEAAAVTEGIMVGCARHAPIPPVDFVADHPFMFMVRDDRNGMVWFMGHVMNPSLE